MKSILVTVIVCAFNLISFAQNNPDAILGKWITDVNNCIVEVYKQDAEYKAKILWFDNKGSEPISECVDEKNPDKSLRSRKIIGMEVLRDLRYNSSNNEWVNGVIYDASCGKEWDSIAWLTKDNLLKVKGYWLFRWLSKTKTFKRVNDYADNNSQLN